MSAGSRVSMGQRAWRRHQQHRHHPCYIGMVDDGDDGVRVEGEALRRGCRLRSRAQMLGLGTNLYSLEQISSVHILAYGLDLVRIREEDFASSNTLLDEIFSFHFHFLPENKAPQHGRGS